ncbi:11280_t:CDS:2, partial [Cetraspora pellucida]
LYKIFATINQDNSTFQYESKDAYNNLLESNSDSLFIVPFKSSSTPYNFEYSTSSSNLAHFNSSLYASEYSTSSHNSEQLALPLDSSEDITLPLDNLDYSNSLNTNFLQSTRKHKSVFVILSNKKSKPGKKKCKEMFILLTSTSTLGAHLRTVHHLLEKEELLGLKELIDLLKPFACATTLMGEDPKIEGYLAAILDPRFKNLEFASEKFEETKKYLRQKM